MTRKNDCLTNEVEQRKFTYVQPPPTELRRSIQEYNIASQGTPYQRKNTSQPGSKIKAHHNRVTEQDHITIVK